VPAPPAPQIGPGGAGDGSGQQVQQCEVVARAVDGQATAAALRALAEALGIHQRDVLLISGGTSRSKVVEIPDGCHERLAELLAG